VSWFTNSPDPTRPPTGSIESWSNLPDYLQVRCCSDDNREQDWFQYLILGREENTMGRVVVTWQRIVPFAVLAQFWWSRVRRVTALSLKSRFTLQWNIVFIGNIMNIFVGNIIVNDFFIIVGYSLPGYDLQ